MFKQIIFLISFTFLVSQDCVDNRYLEEIFEIEVETWIEYGENVNDTWGFPTTEQLYLDVYQPINDELENRPLAIFLFGGAFMYGNRTSPDIVALCEGYAKRGYVTAAIDYRLTPSLAIDNSEENVYSAVVKGVHDFKGAIRYFRKSVNEGNEYKIDPTRIYGGGTSAGSIATIHSAYLSENDAIPELILNIVDSAGGIEGESGNSGFSSEIHGVINLCGGIGDVNWIDENDSPIVSLHGTLDATVPFEGGINLFGVYTEGSGSIHNRMIELGNASGLFTDIGGGHCDFISDMDFVNQFTSEFMYDHVCSTDFIIIGDLNGDDLTNVIDIIITINLILDNEFDENADLNFDEHINVLDILLIVNIILESNI